MVLKIGHRGAKGHAPENTLTSFAKAMEQGVDAIELDVRRCKSGELVVIHDKTLERTTNGAGPVAEKTLAELKELDAGGGEIIPTIEEVIEFVSRKIPLYIELKETGTADILAGIIEDYVAKGWNYADLIVISFRIEALRNIKQNHSGIIIGASFEGAEEAAMKTVLKELKPATANIYHRDMSREIIDFAHSEEIKTIVWTVNEKDEIERFKSMGVDGIISDFPDRL